MGEMNPKVDEISKKHGDLDPIIINEIQMAFLEKNVSPDWEAIDLICGEIVYAVNKQVFKELKRKPNPNEELGILGGMNY